MSNGGQVHDTQVIIVGGGPAGLAMAIELGSRGINCRLIERNDRSGVAPRAKTTNIRTREHLRRWGIADRLAEASPFGVDYPGNILFVTKLGGKLVTRFEHGFGTNPARDQRYSEHAQWIPQYKLEGVLLEHALTLPSVKIDFGTELHGIAQFDDGVVACVRDVVSGAGTTISADYLVGADGSGSTTRKLIGVKMIGTHGLSRNYNTIFEAPGLAEAHDHGPAIQVWQLDRDMPSLIGPMDVDDRWFFVPTGLEAGVELAEEDMPDIIRRSTGIDLPYRVLSSEVWVASSLLAERYSKGRVFLIGDACHLHPPFGGYGMNMGIADSVDLGWKLTAVLNGWGADGLLETYESERRPVHVGVTKQSESNHKLAPNQLARPGLDEASPEGEAVRREVAELIRTAKHSEFYSLGIVLGYTYFGSPIILGEDGSPDIWEPDVEYVPSAVPGCLAPHRWLEDGSSLYDHFGPDFTMLVLAPSGRGAAEEAALQALTLGIPLRVVEVFDRAVTELYEAPLALIRPDQHVAWRGARVPPNLLAKVTGRLIHEADASLPHVENA